MTNTLMPAAPGTRACQSGVSLIEVLISVFVLAFGVLGIAAMQAGALRNNQGAFEQSAAVFLAHSILDAMRASKQPNTDPDKPDRLIVRAGYKTGGFVCNAGAIPDTADALVKNDLARWLTNIQSNLNGGVADDNACGQIVCDTADPNLCTASVRWNNSRSMGGEAAQVVEARSRL
ncbi:MAG: type IV pilus modification protein PilV [Azoarcus sp.]|jgi:type IV pilus assembly protein PilV|nr:type IV pilus modification protein PilV [Azoarcus sp.]